MLFGPRNQDVIDCDGSCKNIEDRNVMKNKARSEIYLILTETWWKSLDESNFHQAIIKQEAISLLSATPGGSQVDKTVLELDKCVMSLLKIYGGYDWC